jgi:hypothetical protein
VAAVNGHSGAAPYGRWVTLPRFLSVALIVIFAICLCGHALAAPLLRLQSATFDPTIPPHDVANGQTASPSIYKVVQCSGPVLAEWRKELESSGADILGYLPDFAYLAKLDPHAESAVRHLDFVRWVGPYLPEYKVSPRLARKPNDHTLKMTLLLFPEQDLGTARAHILATGVRITGEATSGFSPAFRIEATPAVASSIARIEAVQYIEEYVEPKLHNNVARGIMDVQPLWTDPTLALYGNGQIIAVCDTGLDTGNLSSISADFAGRVLSTYDLGRKRRWDDADGHGTHVCGSVLGNGSLSGSNALTHSYSSSFAGVAPEARLVIQSVLDNSGGLRGIPTDLNTLFQPAYNDGARVHTNSWGSAVAGAYTTDSRNVDLFSWNNKQMVIVFSAGNEGVDLLSPYGQVDPDSIGSPATAKNCITVGATESLRTSGTQGTYGNYWPSDFPQAPISNDQVSNNANGMVAFSSRGPCDDGRIKPDLCAPGTNIISCQSHDSGAGSLWGVYDSNYAYSGGTSMSAPLVAGSAALVRQYFLSRLGYSSVSAAMVKAALINGATDLTPGQYGTGSTQEVTRRPDNSQGWGLIDLKNSLAPGVGTLDFRDISTGLSTGQSVTYNYTAHSGDSIRFTLVYTDYPALAGSGVKLVNDLDLEVTAPNGSRIYPNGLTGRDDRNGVEDVDIPNGVNGSYTVRIYAYNVPSGPQPFALVARVVGQAISPAPTVTSITPNTGLNTGSVGISNLAGTGFLAGAVVKLSKSGQPDIIATGVTVVSGAQITCTFNLAGKALGPWNVVVTNPDAQSGSLADGFSITDGVPPTITSVVVNPPMAAAQDAVQVAVNVTDNVGVTAVTANGAALSYAGGNSWAGSISADSAQGLHTVTVIARDAANNTATDSSQSYKTVRAVAISSRCLADITNAVAGDYLFMACGRVTRIDADTFDLNDGFGPIRVAASSHGLQTNDFVCARGSWQMTGSPYVLNCSNAHIVKLN